MEVDWRQKKTVGRRQRELLFRRLWKRCVEEWETEEAGGKRNRYVEKWKRFVEEWETEKAGGKRRKSRKSRRHPAAFDLASVPQEVAEIKETLVALRKPGGDPAASDLASVTSQEVAEIKETLAALQDKVSREAADVRAVEAAFQRRLDALASETNEEVAEINEALWHLQDKVSREAAEWRTSEARAAEQRDAIYHALEREVEETKVAKEAMRLQLGKLEASLQDAQAWAGAVRLRRVELLNEREGVSGQSC